MAKVDAAMPGHIQELAQRAIVALRDTPLKAIPHFNVLISACHAAERTNPAAPITRSVGYAWYWRLQASYAELIDKFEDALGCIETASATLSSLVPDDHVLYELGRWCSLAAASCTDSDATPRPSSRSRRTCSSLIMRREEMARPSA